MSDAPRCIFHVGTQMLALKQVTPSFALADEVTTERTVYKCPFCWFVAARYDPKLKTAVRCRKCRKVAVMNTGALCKECAYEWRKLHPYKRTYISRARAEQHHPRLP